MERYPETSKKRLLLSVCFYLCSVGMFGQTSVDPFASSFFEAPLAGKPFIPPKDGNGFPYLFEDWVTGNVITISGDTVKNKLLNLDCFKNELIWFSGKGIRISLDLSLLTEIIFSPSVSNLERKFIRSHMKLPYLPDTVIRFVEVLAQGSFNVFAYRQVSVRTESLITHGEKRYSVPNYKVDPVYFLQIGNSPVKKVKMRRNDLINAFPEFSDRLEQLLKENYHGRIRNEDQFKAAIRAVNNNWN